ncbi:MAG: transglycosylase SLT domain-containing protein [Actinobacteria bacterium]|nr:transglycosylase SLT domain-containing protein [Actinomycetota bacterium]
MKTALLKSSKKSVAIWGATAALLLVATILPAANALEIATPSEVELDVTKSSAIIEPVETVAQLFNEDDLSATASGAIFSSEMALVSTVSRQVELARTPLGAKKVAKSILLNEYGFAEKEYKCLNTLWTKESHWNYKARNKRSGAHGIAQALPASKMNVVSTDWRTNPVTQIRWGLRYISIRYETPCKALAKHKRSNYY